ncbi:MULTISPECIES: N-acetyl sugar amidotransferase [Pseudomonas]|uniref:N-acetyl sugar amidotransferase n=1 Tax=Pseudomonas TaxID=286 RepID=UPI0006B63641|nr:N-acetyl sugar amidotransferase [Pseudomonas fuscovaginae]KPA96676.1 N-acetyl sugar amidotransferase [Pseudomonas fuscovaginae]
MSKSYQICTRCVMDTSALDISFDAHGVCNYCSEFLIRSGHLLEESDERRNERLSEFVEKVKADGAGKTYDCIVGVSGGVDSSWVLVKAVELGLRPLAVHMDNGWNSELAQNNIANLIKKLNVDLYTHVVDWGEYKALMQAFFDSDVIDVELLYDNAMLAVNYKMAAKYGVSHILSGSNQSSEGMSIPVGWNWFKYDKRNIVCLARRSAVRIKTFPMLGTLGYIYYTYVKKIKWQSMLDMMPYSKVAAMQALKEDFGYKPYPYKHYESIFTRFYQGFLLPRKFSVDKRRVHFSTLIMSGQMTRDAALIDLEKIPYPSEKDLVEDRNYFLKKMRWADSDLTSYLSRQQRSHAEFGSEIEFWKFCMKVYRAVFK